MYGIVVGGERAALGFLNGLEICIETIMSGQKGTKGGGARSNHQTGGRGSASSRKFEKEAYMEDAVVDVAEAANHAQFSSRSAPSFGRYVHYIKLL